MEEGKDPAPAIRTNLSRALPFRLLLFCWVSDHQHGPLPLAPLWDRFFKGHEGQYSIYVHALPSYVTGYPPSSAFHRRQIPSQMVEWGKMSMCEAERRLIANALLEFPMNGLFYCLSPAFLCTISA
ncbi:hypothetical protein REPUB_Repub13aG0183100 [Reevesia pubescens]